jgi:hypothetical protein
MPELKHFAWWPRVNRVSHPPFANQSRLCSAPRAVKTQPGNRARPPFDLNGRAQFGRTDCLPDN